MDIQPVGTIKSSISAPSLVAKKEGIELQGSIKDAVAKHHSTLEQTAEIVIEKKWQELLDGIDGFSHLVVLYWAHLLPEERRSLTRVHPMGIPENPLTGIFATRSPARPNPVLITIVQLLSREGNILKVSGLDAVDGSPVIDIKPYFTDNMPNSNIRIPDWPITPGIFQHRDALTGLENRQAFFEVLDNLDQHSDTKDISVILLDLDNFKYLNDKLGHDAGDELLQQVGTLLTKQAAGLLSVARFGGDEFALVTPFDQTRATAFAEFLRTEIDAIGASREGVTASFGVATGTPLDEASDLLKRADNAMYAAKSQGRNRVVIAEIYARKVAFSDRDELMTNFENRVRTYADRMVAGMLNHARSLATTLRKEAELDALTGLYNRRYLDRVLAREFDKCRMAGATLSIALIDLDDFGAVNKVHGFTTGDHVLAGAAKAIADAIRANDWVARYGGEEFLVVMPDTNADSARGVAERIVEVLRETSVESYNGKDISVTGTAGISSFKLSDVTVEDLLARASDRVRAGKKNGKNQVG